MKNYLKFVRENMDHVKEYLSLQIFVFIFAKMYIFKDAYLEPMRVMVYGSQFALIWGILTVITAFVFLFVWYRSRYPIPELTCAFIYLSFVPSTIMVLIRYFAKNCLATVMAVFLLLYVMVLLVVNHREMFRLENRRKMTRNRLLYMGRIVKQTYRMGMVLAVFFLATPFLSGSFNAFFPNNFNQEKTVNESKMDWNEMSKVLSATKWNNLSTSQKISWLQIITDYTAKEYLGCDTISVEVAPLGKKVWGCYWDALSSESIYISSSLVKSGEPKDVVFTVLHELYHHYEYLCISEVNFNSRNVSELYYFEQIRQWKENASNYIEADKEGYDAYTEQPLEESANSYAEKITKLYFKDVE